MGNFLENGLGKEEKAVMIGKLHFLTILPWHFIRYATTKIGFTNKKVVGKVGFIKHKDLSAPLNKINSVSVKQGLFGKIFNWGTITINTSSDTYCFKGVGKPNQFKNALMNQMDEFDEDKIKKQAQQFASAVNSK